MRKHRLLLLIGLAGFLADARATTVLQPSFEQLVNQAELIFQGEVTAVMSQWAGEGAQRHIVSYVTFRVDEPLKGDPGQSYTIRMLGGTVDGESMGVTDAPRFSVGDREILFVENNGSQFIPLVGIMYGRFHLQRDQTGLEAVLNHEGEPINRVSDFKAAIRSKLREQAAR